MSDTVKFKYHFESDNGDSFTFSYEINDDSLTVINKISEPLPEWTNLDFEKCSHCPLSSEDNPTCPVAKNLLPVIHAFRDKVSHETSRVVVTCNERHYAKKTSLQVGMQSILGLVMATSGCPNMGFFRSMARFHLPFSDVNETLVRATSHYLLGQYFAMKRGEAPDFELKNLPRHYDAAHHVNLGILERLRVATQKDAGKNAIVILDSFAYLVNSDIEEDLASIAKYFS